jgi:hypothetical protein
LDPYKILNTTDVEPGPSAVLTWIGFIVIGLLIDILMLKVLFIVGSVLKPYIFTLWNFSIPFPLVVLIIAAACGLQVLLCRQWYRAFPA